ncbi:hypothetical protein TNCV_623831 [Trichonephila clavipes]|nr:hypothetical protein TNCV_626361 [Trichonephila clavipes]GFV98424.1 hypothetical protein TNCV_623831 [Trichonephila clavipes]
MLKTQVGSCSILEKAHFANASLCAVSAGKSSWHDCNLYGYSWRIRRRILRTDDGGKPNHLAASRALLVPEAASEAIASISTAMQGARAYFKHGRPARARSSNFPVSSKRLTSFKRPAGVKGPFPLFTFFLNSEFTQGNGR